MDASSILLELQQHGIISSGDRGAILMAESRRHQAEHPYACLRRRCTANDWMEVSNIMEGNPKMSVLGEELKRALEKGLCCVGGRVCLCMGVCMW